jgi:hypothetical protein
MNENTKIELMKIALELTKMHQLNSEQKTAPYELSQLFDGFTLSTLGSFNTMNFLGGDNESRI